MTKGLKEKVKETTMQKVRLVSEELPQETTRQAKETMGIYTLNGRPTQTVTAAGSILLINSFIAEAIKKAGNVLMTQKLGTAQTIKITLTHKRPQNILEA